MESNKSRLHQLLVPFHVGYMGFYIWLKECDSLLLGTAITVWNYNNPMIVDVFYCYVNVDYKIKLYMCIYI